MLRPNLLCIWMHAAMLCVFVWVWVLRCVRITYYFAWFDNLVCVFEIADASRFRRVCGCLLFPPYLSPFELTRIVNCAESFCRCSYRIQYSCSNCHRHRIWLFLSHIMWAIVHAHKYTLVSAGLMNIASLMTHVDGRLGESVLRLKEIFEFKRKYICTHLREGGIVLHRTLRKSWQCAITRSNLTSID